MPSSVGPWMYHKTITITPRVPTIVKIANWIRTKRVSIYGPPSVGWLVVGVAPGTGAPWFAGGGPGDAGAMGGGGSAAPGPSIVRPATTGGTGGGAWGGCASADCGLSGAGAAFGGGTPGCQGDPFTPRIGSPTGPGATHPPGAPGGAPYLNCRYSGSPGAGTISAPSRPQWEPNRMLLRSPAFVKSM